MKAQTEKVIPHPFVRIGSLCLIALGVTMVADPGRSDPASTNTFAATPGLSTALGLDGGSHSNIIVLNQELANRQLDQDLLGSAPAPAADTLRTRLLQSGSNLSINLFGTGETNRVFVEQSGSDNHLMGQVSGNQNMANVMQSGHHNFARFTQSGVMNSVSIQQGTW